MALNKLGDGIKKLLLAGIGAAATTVEKSQQIIDDLAKKGEITVEQGKELNKELKENVKKTIDARVADAGSLEEKIAKMGEDELKVLKAKITEAEEAIVKVKDMAGDKIEEAIHAAEEEEKEAAEEEALEEMYRAEGAPIQDIPAEEEDKEE